MQNTCLKELTPDTIKRQNIPILSETKNALFNRQQNAAYVEQSTITTKRLPARWTSYEEEVTARWPQQRKAERYEPVKRHRGSCSQPGKSISNESILKRRCTSAQQRRVLFPRPQNAMHNILLVGLIPTVLHERSTAAFVCPWPAALHATRVYARDSTDMSANQTHHIRF